MTDLIKLMRMNVDFTQALRLYRGKLGCQVKGDNFVSCNRMRVIN